MEKTNSPPCLLSILSPQAQEKSEEPLHFGAIILTLRPSVATIFPAWRKLAAFKRVGLSPRQKHGDGVRTFAAILVSLKLHASADL
jgi:hypothetical protein